MAVEAILALVAAALPLLIVLACPIAMYLLMRNGMGSSSMAEHGRNDLPVLPPARRPGALERRHTELAEEIALARAELASEGERTPAETRANKQVT